MLVEKVTAQPASTNNMLGEVYSTTRINHHTRIWERFAANLVSTTSLMREIYSPNSINLLDGWRGMHYAALPVTTTLGVGDKSAREHNTGFVSYVNLLSSVHRKGEGRRGK